MKIVPGKEPETKNNKPAYPAGRPKTFYASYIHFLNAGAVSWLMIMQ